MKFPSLPSFKKQTGTVHTQPTVAPVNRPSSKPTVANPILSITQSGLSVVDTIAPQSIEVDFSHLKVNDVYFQTLFTNIKRRYVSPGWLEPLINFDSSLDTSFFIYPTEGKDVLDDLRRKIAEMEAEISTDIQRGKIIDPTTQAKLEDAQALQEQLVKGIERFFQFGFYVTIPAKNPEELNNTSKQISSVLNSLLVDARPATLTMERGFSSTIPFGFDKLNMTRNMDTTSLATTFPFTSAELSSDKGILYGVNSQNESFVIFDRFSLENANMTIFATSGAGKSTSYNTEVMYQDKDGKVKMEKIGKLVENIIKIKGAIKLEDDIEGTLNPGIKVFAFDKDLKGEWSKVTVAARKVSPKYLYEIETASGRRVTITKDHCLVCLKDGRVTATKGNKIKIGDFLPIPRNVRIAKIGSTTNAEFSDELLTLLGLITSEGHVGVRVAIFNTDKVVLDVIKNCAKVLELQISPIYNYPLRTIIRGYYFRSRGLLKTVTSVGGCGLSGNKRVPKEIFNLSNYKISQYLKAYFEGDGGVESNEITATTKSKGLASDLAYLLLRFGVVARIRTRSKSATNTVAKIRRTYYQITISGHENINGFVNQIGFLSDRKNNLAQKLLRPGNTNVDIIPELQSTFRLIAKELYASNEIPAPKNFSSVKLGTHHPSRSCLLKIISRIKERIYEIESLETDGISKLRALPTVENIINKGKDKKLNSLLWEKLGHSWDTMRDGIPPNTKNALTAAKVTYNYNIEIDEVGRALYRSFKFTDTSLMNYDSSLWNSTLYNNMNARYKKLLSARDYISDIYDKKIKRLKKVKEKVAWLEILAKSEIFWDPIVKIKKVKSLHKFVYDLEVDNRVFLAGHGGMFIHNSYFTKLEALRSFMFGTETIIIDPENEYKDLAQAVGGEYISFSFNSPSKINPFDLSQIYEEGENQLGLKILSLHSLFKVIMGQLTPTQEAMLDRALVATYRAKGITQDPATQTKEPPLMEDLYKVLVGMEVPEAMDLAARIEKFVKGSFVGIFDKQTNIDLKNPFTVFSVRDMEDALRPIAMFIILDYIWTRVRREKKRRLLIVDEAWHMMRYPDSAQFLWSIVKRARKYYLGLTTITQDVEDFLGQDIGKAIVTNSALRLLLKQSPAAIDKIGEIFYLSQGERQLLLAANIGEGIFFAGPHHAPIRVVASRDEHNLITTNPQEIAQKMESATPAESVTIANVTNRS